MTGLALRASGFAIASGEIAILAQGAPDADSGRAAVAARTGLAATC